MPRRIYSVFDWHSGEYDYYDAGESYRFTEEPPPMRSLPPSKIGHHIEDFLVSLPAGARRIGRGPVLIGEGAIDRRGPSIARAVMGLLGFGG